MWTRVQSTHDRINRYIMECKYGPLDRYLKELAELIDTLWNVNEIKVKARLTDDKRINRYIMECKYNRLCKAKFFDTRINRYIMECKYRKTKQRK